MNFILRPWSLQDLENLTHYANNPNIARFMMDQFPHPYTAEAGTKFIEMAISMEPVRLFAIEVDGKAAGGIGIHPLGDIQCKNAELGYWLAEPYWGQGIISEAIREITDYGFRNFDLTRIFARPFGSNIGSQKALEKAGFKLEGRFEKTFYKNGEFEDELIYAIRKT